MGPGKAGPGPMSISVVVAGSYGGSLLHSSSPVPSSSAVNSSVPFAFTDWFGEEEAPATVVLMSSTMSVEAAL